MNFESISPSELVTGKPLAFDVFTRQGALLLSRGSLITADDTRLYLIENALKISAKKAASGAAFVRMERVAERLLKIEEDFIRGFRMEAWVARVRALARDIIEIADDDFHAAFAAMHLDIHHAYDVIHPLVASLVSARLALPARLTTVERTSLVCAAITHDIDLVSKRRVIESGVDLVGSAKELVLAHCHNGVDLLREAGVDDPLWLRAVNEHHERLDGSGYSGLKETQLAPESRILALADSFSAMLRVRPYRDRVLAKTALSDLYADPHGRYDKALVTCLVRELGLFPPGSVLRLASREIAVSIRPTPDQIKYPVIAAIADHAGRPFLKAVPRNPRLPETSITGLLPPEKAGPVRKLLPDCWK